MGSLERLVGAADQVIFDRESLLREVLSARIFNWLDGKRFYVSEFNDMRDIALDISGVLRACEPARLPADVARLHCIGFESLSPVNLRECVRQVLGYIGINEKTGIDLMGHAKWAQLQERVEVLGRIDSAMTRGRSVSPWVQMALASQTTSVFARERFCYADVVRIADALQALRQHLGLRKHDARGIAIAGLRALDGVAFESMEDVVRIGIKEAVWEVCGIHGEIGPLAYGTRWADVDAVECMVQA